jgi:hypothetical protein
VVLLPGRRGPGGVWRGNPSPIAVMAPLVSKVGIAVGRISHLAQRDCRSAITGAAVGGCVLAISIALAPAAWVDSSAFITSNYSQPPAEVVGRRSTSDSSQLGDRLVGARTDRRWVVPFSAGVAIPALYPWAFVPPWLGPATHAIEQRHSVRVLSPMTPR